MTDLLTLMHYASQGKLPPHNGTATSRAAALAKRPTADTDEAKVFAAFCVAGEATDEEVQLALGMSGDTERPRRVRLVEKGLLKESGRTRLTTKGRQAKTYILGEAA